MGKDLFGTNNIPVIGPDYDSQNYGVKNVDATIQQIEPIAGVKQVIKTSVTNNSTSSDNFYNDAKQGSSTIRTSVTLR